MAHGKGPVVKRTYLIFLIMLLITGDSFYYPEVSIAFTSESFPSLTIEDLKTIHETIDHRYHDILYWYQSFPTVGMRLEEPYWPPPYPFIPHDFSLWELAPHQGDAVTIALLDNGVAGIVAEQSEMIAHHNDVVFHPDVIKDTYCMIDEKTTKPIAITRPYVAEVYKELLPIPHTTTRSTLTPSSFNHGTHTYSLINGTAYSKLQPMDGLCGLAPLARTLAIKVCDDKGIGKFSYLVKGIAKAKQAKADIINLSLGLSSLCELQPTFTNLLHELESVTFSVIASGNIAHRLLFTKDYPYIISTGAFGINKDRCFIPPFSQYLPKKGPLFVAPGYNILGPICGTKQSYYTFRHGTSLSAAMMSGFMALILGEFKNLFSRDEYLYVCSLASLKMHNDKQWHDASVHGVVDMRMALFMFHVLKQLKLERKSIPFKPTAEAIRSALLRDPYKFGKEHKLTADFTESFMNYFIEARSVPNKSRVTKDRNLQKAIHAIALKVAKKIA